ncbi:HNH endonuclease [Chloroflexota bacterium]
MSAFYDIISKLPSPHKDALSWFYSRTGEINPWPQPIPRESPVKDGKVFLASKAKGIYKPEWSNYALSVRQSLDSPYYDGDPILRDDGTWSYLYYQENPDPLMRDREYTNRGLVRCIEDMIPVGVIRQVKKKPGPRYQVLGVAIVTGWEEGYFFLEGFSNDGEVNDPSPQPLIDAIIDNLQKQNIDNGIFDPHNIFDAREKTIAPIIRRRGQPQFRKELLKSYEYKCAISGCDTVEVLEAVHIIPYKGPDTNHVSNGLLLRVDFHLLFDLGLIAIDAETMKLVISSRLSQTEYSAFNGTSIAIPDNIKDRPSIEALKIHRNWTRL